MFFRRKQSSRNNNILIVVLFAFASMCGSFTQSGYSKIDFGNVLKQEVMSLKITDPEVEQLVEYCWQYAEKRIPWSVPTVPGQVHHKPQVIYLYKANLVYSYDNEMPLYYDGEVMDNTGQHHGITSFILLGSAYKFGLSWKHKTLLFTHNFTLSVYPKNKVNVYSHSCYVKNTNATDISNGNYLFPKYDKIDLKNDLPVNGIKKMSRYAILDKDVDFNFIDPEMQEHIPDHVTDFDQSDSSKCTSDGCNTLPREDNENFNIKYANYMSRQFSIMSYNVWNMNSKSLKKDGYTRRMQHLKKTIMKANPDIVGLQEIRYEEAKGDSLGPSQIYTLSEWLPQYQFVYQPAQMQPNTLNDGRTEEGVAIMSKYPIISHDYLLLFINRSNSADLHQRILLHAEIYIPLLGMVHVFVTHLSLSHEAREQSVVQIWQHVKKFKGPVFILGDLNAEPKERAVQYLNGKDIFPGEDKSLLVDVWRKMNQQRDLTGNTFSSLNKNLTKRIDYIFFRGWNNCCKIERCHVVDDGTRGIHAASDHVPLLASFSFHEGLKSNS